MVREPSKNRRAWFAGVFAAATLLIGLAFSVPLVEAGEARYVYDDLGRLHQVIDEHGDVATYISDAVGNILSITRETGCIAVQQSNNRGHVL